MNIKLIKNIGIVSGCTLGILYALFLIAPFIISPILNNYIPTINEEIHKSTGLLSELGDLRLVTTPKLTVGIKVGRFSLFMPDKTKFATADNFQAKMSLLPLLKKELRADVIKLDNIDITLLMKRDGSFEIEKYIPQQEQNTSEKQSAEAFELPFGLKLSNHLPDIRLGKYSINFTDSNTKSSYVIKGSKINITDFVFNKGFKLAADGSMTLCNREQFKYNIKLHNKIMPEDSLNDFIFNQQPEEKDKKANPDFNINLSDIFRNIYNYNITANLTTDITTQKDEYTGFVNLDNVSVSPNGITIPPSDMKLILKGNKINIDSNIYTAKNEKSLINGTIKTGKNTALDLNIKSDADLSNIVRIVNAIAMTFNIKDLQTLSANGKLNADFNIKSDMKKVFSNGFLKVPSAKIRYGLYDITIDNINADIALTDNNINIKNIGFSILNQPLKLFGTIKEDATSDIHLTADNLSLKGLIIACGQAALLKENQVNSGLVSLKAEIVGKLDKIKPTAKITLSNLNILNIPSNTKVLLPNTNIDIVTDGQAFNGTAVSTGIKAINPVATVNIPKLSAIIEPDVIKITETPVHVEKINFSVNGTIKNYMSEKMSVQFITTGDIKSKLTGDINVLKQTLNLVFATTQNSTIVVPMYNKSKMTFNGNVNITGHMVDPQLSGTFVIPAINIPEIPVTMDNLTAKLHGSILNGYATVEKFTSGGIAANTITSDFSMKGENFYLKNLKGNSFDGKFSGNITYNMANAKTSLDFKGEGMNAEKAIEGTTGIKKALSGTLNFDTKLALTIFPEYNDMIRSMTGNLSFKITEGAFGSIGRLENFLQAGNIIGNTLLKTTVGSFSNIASVKNSAEFDYISGEMTFSNGWANISKLRSTGKSVAYFITGKFNLINNSANLTILGRLNGKIVKLLGPIGDLSAEKILSAIPKLGSFTAGLAKELSTNPDKERTSEIPNLSDTTDSHKDFKVVVNGGVESTSSVKSFKWLSKPDLSNLEQPTVTDSVKSLKTNIHTDLNNAVNSIVKQKEQYEATKQELKDSVNEIKNLFKF